MDSMQNRLANIVWRTFLGPHAQHSIGTDQARRYRPGFPPIVAFADPDAPAWDALVPYTEPGEHLYCDGWAGRVPAGWTLESEGMLLKMIWDGAPPTLPAQAADTLWIVPLDATDEAAVLELFALVRPGPYGPRMLELGVTLGVFDQGQLIAVAACRECAGGLSEISSVVTHPAYRGRGLASAMVATLVQSALRKQETPFLRVYSGNTEAIALYRRLGFRPLGESVARVIFRS